VGIVAPSSRSGLRVPSHVLVAKSTVRVVNRTLAYVRLRRVSFEMVTNKAVAAASEVAVTPPGSPVAELHR
jgi:hypothetical protein